MAVFSPDTPFQPPELGTDDSADRPELAAPASLYRRIVVPFDGSRLAEAALEPAAELAARTGASVLLVHAITPVRIPDIDLATGVELARTDARAMLAGPAGRFATAGVNVNELLVVPPPDATPNPAQAILTAADRAEADLIIMTTHGRTGLRRAVFGSVADAVIRRAKVPVLLVPAAATRGNGPLRLSGDGRDGQSERAPCVVIALDGSPECESALEPGAVLAAAIGGGVELVRAVPEQQLLLGPSYGVQATACGTREYLSREAEALLTAHPTLHFARTAAPVTTPDHVPAAIAAHAADVGASAIALATHGRGGLRRLVRGSVTAAVIGAAGVPVLVVPPGCKTDLAAPAGAIERELP